MSQQTRRTARHYHMNCSKTCRVCGCKLSEKSGVTTSATIDHLIPQCQGGTDVASNLMLVCHGCNHSKGGRTPEQWVQTIAAAMGVDLFALAGRPSPFDLAVTPNWI